MASTIVELQLPTDSSSPELSLYSLTDDTALANSGGADAFTEETNAAGFWRATVTEALTGIYRVKVLDGVNLLYTGYVYVQDDTSVYYPADNYSGAYQLSLGAGGDATAANQATIIANIAALNDLSAAQVNAEVDTALADYDAPTKAELDSAFAALNDLSAAQVNAEVDTALADYDAPTKAELDSAFAEIKGATFSESTDSLEAIRDRGDAAWVGSSGAVEATRTRAWAFTATNRTIYALIYNASDQVYNGSTFEAYNSANYATYAQAATEETGTGKYSLALPADAYAIEFREQFSGTPSVSADTRIGSVQV